jgi:hypothetical protein
VKVSVEQRAPMVRCYKCGSSQVSALCHHCRRPGCAKHVLPSPRWAERLFGSEGGGPGLEKVRARHCGDCSHVRAGTAGTTSRLLAIGVAGTGLAVTGLIAIWLSLIAGLILLLAGGISATWACSQIRHGAVQVRRGLPVPLHPKVADVQLTEQIRGEITLGAHSDDYRTVLKPVEGKVSMTLTFGRPDRDRVWRRRKHLRARDAGVPYSAGLVMLQGPSGIKVGEQVGGPVLALDGNTGDYPVFRTEDAPSSSQWSFARQYELRTEPDIRSGPVWITPSIVPESERHALELDIQWVGFGPDEDKPLCLDVIELLRLEFPVDWGVIHSWRIPQGVSPLTRAVSGLAPEGRQSLELKRLRPAGQGKEDQERRATRLTLSIRFAGQVDPEDEISGRLRATMQGTLSGVTGVGLFNPLGERRRHGGTASITTRLDANFRLSLASIRYQAVRVVPDRAAEDSDRDSYADEFPVVPGDETVIALTNAISEEGYYVKHVIENPPRSGKRADLVQRYWDIAGRRYEGVYPIDFHIILTGEEVHSGDIRPERGTTKVRIVVKGAYTDDEMDTRIGDEWKRLRELTKETLKRQDSAASEPAEAC